MFRDAKFSETGKHRFWLFRAWDETRPAALIIGHNPSVADAVRDDMTAKKGVGFAARWRMGSLWLANLFPWVSTRPEDLAKATDMRLEENDRHIIEIAARASVIVVAWGASKRLAGRDLAVTRLLSAYPLKCIGRTKDGFPHHPSRIAYATELEDWRTP